MPVKNSEVIETENSLTFNQFKEAILNDYKLAVQSRETSLLGRKEVLTGKAKFGIFGDGKELPQIAMAKVFKEGDFRSGYYRDQTFMFAAGMTTIEQFFAQLYANTDIEAEPSSGGRQMNAHFATRSLDEKGEWKDLKNMKNSSADSSPTASQMARGLGLAMASKCYRQNEALSTETKFSNNGDEVIFCTIGDASTSEGIFWEALNAAGVLKVPMAVFIWDDGYGISVPREFQTTKGSISEILEGFRTNEDGIGIDIYTVKAWDYPSLCETFERGIARTRETHTPAVFHIQDVTQPQGHSTSGSHERYKSKERLEWEKEFDCIRKMKDWMLENAIATEDELEEIEKDARSVVNESKKQAWEAYLTPLKNELKEVDAMLERLAEESSLSNEINTHRDTLKRSPDLFRRDILKTVKHILRVVKDEDSSAKATLIEWKNKYFAENNERYNSYLYSQSEKAALNIPEVKPVYKEDAPVVNGFEVLNACFDAILKRDATVFAFGEDVGKIGDVNQGFSGLQEKYGINRIFDTGIREATIMGQGIGMAMRGLRPIAEIQYLDYLIYGLQPLTDDLVTLQYRTRGGQKAPLIIRTRGHRLEGIWHTGSPMGMIINSLRGMHVLVPRNMTQAAGFYNTMLRSDEPALIIECLNGYRLKERLPDNISEFTLPLGVPEILQEGNDVTIVTYGSCCRVAMDAVEQLKSVNISCELIDVQSLLPFDVNHLISKSLEKTNRILFLDEDVPGGASAYMMQQVLEVQGGYRYLDAAPKTVTAAANRVAYGSDADYFSKSNAEDVFEAVYSMMNDADPKAFPLFY